MECCITHVFCMQGALIFHRWLSDIVPATVNRLSRNTWLEKLAFDVRNAIEQKKKASFNSTNYLPNLAFPRVYSLTPPNFRYERTELIISVVSSIVRLWLHFPSDEYSFLQLSLIDIVTSKSPSSVLFLDKIWDMYKSPFSTFFSKWNKKTSKTRMKASLAYFEEQFACHPFATVGSLEHRKLEYLLQLITQWTDNNGGTETTGMASRIFYTYLLLFLYYLFLVHQLIQNTASTSMQAQTSTEQSAMDISPSMEPSPTNISPFRPVSDPISRKSLPLMTF